MLTQIHIHDLATIEGLHLDLKPNSTMITGETGAGKSIFIVAIELALGGRASPNLIRPGKTKASISLGFDISHFPQVIERLQGLDLYQDNAECLVRRTLLSDGRSRCYVNGSLVPIQLVKELGNMLFHFHGQHEQQVLLKEENQREMLDRYAGLVPLATKVKHLSETWRGLALHIKALRDAHHASGARSDYLRFQLAELEDVVLGPHEWQALEAEHNRLAHADELARHLESIHGQLAADDHHALLSLINEAKKGLETVQAWEPKSAGWLQTLEQVTLQLEDLNAELTKYLEQIELDPEKLQQLEMRISTLFALSRKHKVQPEALFSLKEQLMAELAALSTGEEELARLEQEKKAIMGQYEEAANQLSQRRRKAAIELEKEVTQTIRSLSLPHGQFNIAFEKACLNDGTKDEKIGPPFGHERPLFLIKTNPGHAFQPIAKIISGGELSRLSLAMHLALACKTHVPALVFDEVDAGLSGAAAEKIGRLLYKLGQTYQVFCVTHQAQVAACGHHHLLVEKYFENNVTHTHLRDLDAIGKTREIARMLGGEKITQLTLEHAKEMLAST